MSPDFQPPPRPAIQVRAAALRAAFPAYTVNVIQIRGDGPRFEAVSRDGRSPYCLISSDAREIWRELRHDALRTEAMPTALPGRAHFHPRLG
jgi:hypothetical protein